ncbi:hypothetical protein JTB14_008377 [Gonioctena quinquepunctata]|nr:hypothetical protein JTB14_008377 [Gonioctena quinquepunctata]
MKPDAAAIKKDLTMRLDEVQKRPMLKAITKVTPILAKSTIKTMAKPPTILTFRNAVSRQVSAPVNVTRVGNISTIRSVALVPVNRKTTPRMMYEDEERAFPKPAYSYSCLCLLPS